jgi:hypothetical protein
VFRSSDGGQTWQTGALPRRPDRRGRPLERSVEPAGHRKPTDQSQEVFDLLSGLLQVQLDRLATIVASDVPAFNTLLQARGLAPIVCNA